MCRRDRLPPLIRKLAKKLAAKHRQRYRRAKRGRLDLGKTLRRNIALGGVPFHRYWKSTRREKSEIFVLCDLSGSVSSWSQVLMLFMQALADVLPNTRSFVFCGESVEVSELFRQHDADERGRHAQILLTPVHHTGRHHHEMPPRQLDRITILEFVNRRAVHHKKQLELVVRMPGNPRRGVTENRRDGLDQRQTHLRPAHAVTDADGVRPCVRMRHVQNSPTDYSARPI